MSRNENRLKVFAMADALIVDVLDTAKLGTRYADLVRALQAMIDSLERYEQ